MAQQNKALGVLIIVILAVIAIVAYFFIQGPKTDEIIPSDDQEQANFSPPAAEDNAELQERDVSAEELTSTQNETAVAPIPHGMALKDRILGNPNAPIRIAEFASFSCGHCASFHNNVFPQFVKEWIDTGRAYFVFSDFPLNAPALHASLATRCIKDDDKYFTAVKELFEKQKDWAFQADYFTPLKEIVTNYGLSPSEFQSCVRDEKLQEGLLGKVRANQQQFGVSSTPSFVINNNVTIAGSTSYEVFNKALEEAVAGGGNETP
jgi:protein-disulfide isomerase